MTRNGSGPAGLDRLEVALDTYGADRTRWPAPLRLALSGLIATSSEAQKLLADAEAFDRLLDRAPEYSPDKLAKLGDRIAAAAARQPRLVATSGGGDASPSEIARPVFRRSHGFTMSALAASLMLGIFAGQTNVLNSTADMLLSSDAASSASPSRQVAQTDDADSLLDEDML